MIPPTVAASATRCGNNSCSQPWAHPATCTLQIHTVSMPTLLSERSLMAPLGEGTSMCEHTAVSPLVRALSCEPSAASPLLQARCCKHAAASPLQARCCKHAAASTLLLAALSFPHALFCSCPLPSVCYMMQQPALPYLVDKLGASTTQFASLQSLFNGAQAVGGLLSGGGAGLG